MVFLYTPGNNGTYQIPTRAQGVEQESGYDVWPFTGDRHIMSIRPDTCNATEVYNLYPAGAVDQVGYNCPTCTSQSGLTYNAAQSLIPTNGTTDAAGLPFQIGILKMDELRYALATGGAITHALRTTLKNSILNKSFVWPATAYASPSGQIPYGTRIRLKSSYTFTSPSGNPYVPILLAQLKHYGLFTADGSSINYEIYSDGKSMPEAVIQTAATELQGATGLTANFEVVDESGLNNNDGTAMVIPGNAAAPTFAAVVATDSTGSTTMQVALQGLALDVPDTKVFVQAGAPPRQLVAYSSGGPDTSFAWTISPSIGSMTSGGLYTPPSTAASPTAVTATVTSTANAALARTTTIYVLPNTSSTVRLLLNSYTSNYTDSGGNVWYAMAGGLPMYPMMPGGSLYGNGPLQNSPPDPTLYGTDYYTGGDMFLNTSLPAGHYKVTLKLNSGEAGPNELGIDFETQHIIVQHQLDVAATAGGAMYAYDLKLPLTVAADGVADIRLREATANANWHSFISSIQIAPDAAGPSVKIERGVYYGQSLLAQANTPYNFADNITRAQTRQFFAQGWYEANTVTWSIVSGPGSIDSNGLYSAPFTPPTVTVPVTVRATSTVNGATDDLAFNFAFGTMVVSPAGIDINRQAPQAFSATINGFNYSNVRWSIPSGPGSIDPNTGLYSPPSSLPSNSVVTIRATSLDDWTQSADAEVTVMKNAIPIRISGSSAFTDGDGYAWADEASSAQYWQAVSGTMFLWGSAWTCNNCASLGIDPRIVQGRRYAPMGSEFDLVTNLPNGNYTVTMYWMEGDTSAVDKFDVIMQGVTVLSGFDAVAAAGGYNLAVTRRFTTLVVDGTLRIRFIGNGGSYTTVAIGGISVVEITPVMPVCSAGNAQEFSVGHPGTLDGTGSSPEDGGNTLTFLWQQLSGPQVTWGRTPIQPIIGRGGLAQLTTSDQKTAQPVILGLAPGSYTFQLTVTDGSGHPSVCTVDDEAVVTDHNGVLFYLNWNRAAVPGAVAVRVTAMAPDGTDVPTECASSPCAITAYGQGDRPAKLEYLSGSGAVLARTQIQLMQTQ
jgi:hypothetical protein